MADPVKYTFDHAFDGGAKTRFDLEIEQIKEEGVKRAEEAYAKGIEDGRAQALTEIEAQTQEVLTQLTASSKELLDQRLALESSLKQEMVHLAYGIASKLSAALIRTKPTAEVQALIEDCLATASKEPRLVVRVAEDVRSEIAGRIDEMKNATSFSGDIVLIGEPQMSPMDCRIEWPDGGSERKQNDVQHQIEDAVQRFVISDTEDEIATGTNTAQPTDTHEENSYSPQAV